MHSQSIATSRPFKEDARAMSNPSKAPPPPLLNLATLPDTVDACQAMIGDLAKGHPAQNLLGTCARQQRSVFAFHADTIRHHLGDATIPRRPSLVPAPG